MTHRISTQSFPGLFMAQSNLLIFLEVREREVVAMLLVVSFKGLVLEVGETSLVQDAW